MKSIHYLFNHAALPMRTGMSFPILDIALAYHKRSFHGNVRTLLSDGGVVSPDAWRTASRPSFNRLSSQSGEHCSKHSVIASHGCVPSITTASSSVSRYHQDMNTSCDSPDSDYTLSLLALDAWSDPSCMIEASAGIACMLSKVCYSELSLSGTQSGTKWPWLLLCSL